MGTTLIIEDELLDRARELTGIADSATLVRVALESLIARDSGKRLAKLRGTQPQLHNIPRRRPA